MDFQLLIRVETVDGDVDYLECKYDYVVVHDRGLTINLFQIQKEMYPEYRLCDLLVRFVAVYNSKPYGSKKGSLDTKSLFKQLDLCDSAFCGDEV